MIDDKNMCEEDKVICARLRKFINETPELTSLLHDLDLLPEQVGSDGAFTRLLLIAGHFEAFAKRLQTSTIN